MPKLITKLTHLLLISLLLIQNIIYPWISILPAPPPVYAQESPPLEASHSAATPAPSPLDPLLNLEEIFPSTQSAELVPPEVIPEATQSALPEPIPETIATPSATIVPSPSPEFLQSPRPTSSPVATSPSSASPPEISENSSIQTPKPLLVLDPFAISLSYPLQGQYPISYNFGEESPSDYVRGMQSIFGVVAHDGIDFAAPVTTNILATDNGTVISVGPGLYGITIQLEHTWGTSYYGHLLQTSVTLGEKVIAGQLIGYSGESGKTTGPHLHFGIRPNHSDPHNGYHGMIDPLPYLKTLSNSGQAVLGTHTTTKKLHSTHHFNLLNKTQRADKSSFDIPFLADPSKLTLTLTDPQKNVTLLDPKINDFGTGPTLTLPKPDPFYPGEYILSTQDDSGNFDEQSFTWGVLALNSSQAIYHPGSTAKLSFAVLDNQGEMVCDAELTLTVTDPFGNQQILSTTNHQITINENICKSKDLTLTPDYETSYKVNGSGAYSLHLTAITKNGSYSIDDQLTVSTNSPFYIERELATRIYPINIYPVIIRVTPSTDYRGTVTESIPRGFSINNVAPTSGQVISNQISWSVDWKAGNSYELSYTFDAPDVSPAFYLLGPLTLGDWQEPRAWQIAGDAVTDYSFQRKTWFDGTRYWRAYHDTANSRIRFDYSLDSTSWTENTTARVAVNTADFSIEADSSNLFVVYTSSNDIRGQKATSYPGTSFAWGAEGTILNGSGSTDDYSYPVIARDSSSYVWVGARFTGNSLYYLKTIKEAGGTNDLPEDSGDSVYSLGDKSNTSANVYANLVALGSQDIYTTFMVNAAILGCKWVNASTAWQDSSGNYCTTPSSWYSPSWPYRQKLTIDHTKVGADQTDFPIYLNLADMPASFHSHINQTDARDLRITKADGTTELPREIVFYDSTTDTGELHFKYTGTLSSSIDTDIYLYYGNSAAADYAVGDAYGTQNVWDSNYAAVYHLKETSGHHLDSTSNAKNSTTETSLVSQGSAIGKLGGADEFDGTASVVVLPAIALTTDTGTMEAWVKTDVNTYPRSALGRYYSQQTLDIPGTSQKWNTNINPASYASYYVTIDTSNWHHMAGTYDGSLGSANLNLFFDGINRAQANGTGNITNEAQVWKIGNAGSKSGFWDGKVDEVRFSTTVRSSTWFSTQYNNQNSSSTFYSEGTEENSFYRDAIATGTTGLTTTLSTLSDGSGNVHLIYIDNSGHTIYQERTTSWQTAVTLDSNAGNTYPTLSSNSTTGDLYAFWIRTADIFYKKGVSTYASGNWDASATSWKTTGTNTFVTSNYSGTNRIFAQWYDGSAVAWDKILPSNAAPNSPTALTQTTITDGSVSTGSWVSATSIKFSATATDPDNPDTLELCVEKDILGTSFSNTEDSCGSGIAYSGTGVTVSVTIAAQADASQYHWQARLKDTAGDYSAWVAFGGNAESAADYGLDTTASTGGTVYDGTGTGVDASYSNSSLSSLSANWGNIDTNVSGLNQYEYSIGTAAGGTDIRTWTSNTTSTSVTATGLTLSSSTLYYFNVRTTDNAGNVSAPISSNGQLVSPSISFTLSPATMTFNNLSPTNLSDTQTTTLTTTTNAYNGYVIRGYVADYLRSTDGNSTIPDFSAGSYASPATWAGAETGFGYTSSDTTIGGLNKFGTGTLYAPFSHNGPGDIVADHTDTVSGTAISNEIFTLTYKVKIAGNQDAKNYRTNVIYTATAQY
jgi:hypothetical protein